MNNKEVRDNLKEDFKTLKMYNKSRFASLKMALIQRLIDLLLNDEHIGIEVLNQLYYYLRDEYNMADLERAHYEKAQIKKMEVE